MRAMMPNMLDRMQSPEVQSMMSNPQALNAIMQIQQGMEQLRQVAPDLVGSMGIPPPVIPVNLNPSTTTTNTTSSDATEGVIPPSPTLANNPALFSDFMARMLGGMANQQNPNQPPEERYRSQLEQLTQMGFVNRDANLQGELERKNEKLRGNVLIFLWLFDFACSPHCYLRRHQCGCGETAVHGPVESELVAAAICVHI